MKKFKVLLSTLSLLTIGAANASQLVLDSFNYDPVLDLKVTSNLGEGTAVGSVISAESFANADYTLNYTGGSGSNTVEGNVYSQGQLAYNEGSTANGDLTIKYYYADASTIDFTGYTAFYFDIIAIDANGGFDVEISLVDNLGATISATYSVNSLGTYIADFAAMSADPDYATFNWTQVVSATTYITSDGNADDFTLSEVGLVPEPSALAVLGLGLLGLGLRRRKII